MECFNLVSNIKRKTLPKNTLQTFDFDRLVQKASGDHLMRQPILWMTTTEKSFNCLETPF